MIEEITFGSVCSGIEAASVAWAPLGWKAAWLSEIEPFPCAVLAHHYPDVPNLGDMTKIAHMIRDGFVPAPDVFCGGTPCQAFSIAGLRNSLDDARGNLSLTFCEIANEIDTRRAATGLLPSVVFWENVPGVLSTKDNAFGCFLAGLAGEDDPLLPAGDKWTNAGIVFGPKRVVAWRVTDAQFFGVAQRRRRVFVVASAREGFDPAAVLFEPESLHRNSAPSREQRQETAGTLTSSLGRRGGQPDCGSTPGLLQPVRGLQRSVIKWPAEIAATLNASFGDKQGLEDQHINGGASWFVPAPIAFDSRQDPVSSPHVFGALGSSSPQAQAVCVTGEITHTLKAEGFDASEDGTGRGQPIVAAHAFDARQSDVIQYGDFTGPLDTCGFTIGVQQAMAVRRLTPRECERLQSFQDDYTLIPFGRRVSEAKLDRDFIKYLMRGNPKHLTREDIGRLAADGPRYKALGNSWCVYNVRWIGARIDQKLRGVA